VVVKLGSILNEKKGSSRDPSRSLKGSQHLRGERQKKNLPSKETEQVQTRNVKIAEVTSFHPQIL